MDYQVILSPSARNDLRVIVRYISMDAPDQAIVFGKFLVSKTRQVGQFPEWGRVVPEFGDPLMREIIVRSYRVIYRINHPRKLVEVVRYWHAARGEPTLEP